jgi:hypothetical protein
MNCLKQSGKTQINLHGEAGDMESVKRAAIMDEWRTKEFWPLIEKYKIPLSRIYNDADQTGLFYQKLPNSIYVDKKRKHEYKGAKQTLMPNSIYFECYKY